MAFLSRLASGYSPLVREAEATVQELAFRDAPGFAKQVLWTSIVLIGIILFIGGALISMREFYFYIAPSIIEHSHTWVGLINAVRLDFFLEIEAIRIIVFAVKEALRFISAGRFPRNVPKLRDVAEPTMLNASALRHSLKVSTVACHKITSAWVTVMTMVRARTSEYVCPLLRAVWPLGAVNTTASALGSWLAYDANPQGNNCNASDYDRALADTCFAINSGLVVIEVILPAILVFFILKHFTRGILKLLKLVGEAFATTLSLVIPVPGY